MTPIHGNPLKICLSTNTKIPPIEFNQITQIKSSPETIAALLNEAELSHSRLQKTLHGNARRAYPFWKVCTICSAIYPCHTKEQAGRNKTCSAKCSAARVSAATKGVARIPLEERRGITKVKCAVCGKEIWKQTSWLRRIHQPTCSKHCNGILRGAEWVKHAHKGRAAWTEQGKASYTQKMSGANNPAWRGGVTYFRKHGNYKPIKYVRCPQDFISMARKDGYVMEHRLIVAQAIGRPLLRVEVVHHINHDPQDNSLTNLLLFATNQAHKLFEARGTPAPIWPQ